MKRVFLIGGGTGGHCIPMSVVYMQAPKRYECHIITDERGKKYFKDIDPKNIIIIKNLISSQSTLSNIINAPFLFIQSLWHYLSIRPHVSLGFGGFFTIPVLFSGLVLNKKVFIHEGNAFIGKANRFLVKFIGKILTTFRETQGLKRNHNIKLLRVGLPIRVSQNSINKVKRKGEITICVLGGSQGARGLSDDIAKSIIKCKGKLSSNLNIFHQCRFDDMKSVKNIYDNSNINCQVKSYFNDII
mgnify:CR=1 FL=1